jgi:hypothetical protein
VSVKIHVERLGVPLDQLELVTREDLRELGLLARERIVRRTRQGLGPGGVPFQPLSEGYAKRKRAALGTDAPDLTVSGRMLNALQITDIVLTDDEAYVELGFSE